MNEYLHRFIGKHVTVIVKLIIDNNSKEEYIQGILKNVEDDILTIEQHVPFCNLFVNDAETIKIERTINTQNIISPNGIKVFK